MFRSVPEWFRLIFSQVFVALDHIGLSLKDQHVKQAIDYAANQGIDWVVLTNGAVWRIYRLVLAKPIGQDLILDVDLLNVDAKQEVNCDTLYLWSREAWQKSALGEYTSRKQALSKFFLGAALQQQPVLDVLRREMRRISPNVKFDTSDLLEVLVSEVIKRDVLEGQEAEEAKAIVTQAAENPLRIKQKRSSSHRINSRPTIWKMAALWKIKRTDILSPLARNKHWMFPKRASPFLPIQKVIIP